MAKWVKVHSNELVEYRSGETYSSKLLTGDEMAGHHVVNINEGTLAPFSRTAGAAHEDTEIYYMVDVAEGSKVVLDDEPIPVKNGDIIIIPGGVFHWIDNLNCDKPFVLFTVWPDERQNNVYHKRMAAWGKSMKYKADEE